MDAILILFVMLGALAGLAASAGSFGVDSRDGLLDEYNDHRA